MKPGESTVDPRPGAAFDAAADLYDIMEAGQPEFARIRLLTQKIFRRYFARGDRLLELNCGTGTDAVALARTGLRIVATDASHPMLAAASAKAHAAGLQETIEFRQVSFEQLGELDAAPFDGAYSNFGGLNCTRDVGAVAANLARLVRPGGFVVATVMPRFCLWETASMAFRLRFESAFRRFNKEGVPANISGVSVRTFYHSPGDFRRAFQPAFARVALYGLNVLTPPPGHVRAYRGLRPALPALRLLDRLACRVPLLRSVGDHYIMVLRKS